MGEIVAVGMSRDVFERDFVVSLSVRHFFKDRYETELVYVDYEDGLTLSYEGTSLIGANIFTLDEDVQRALSKYLEKP